MRQRTAREVVCIQGLHMYAAVGCLGWALCGMGKGTITEYGGVLRVWYITICLCRWWHGRGLGLGSFLCRMLLSGRIGLPCCLGRPVPIWGRLVWVWRSIPGCVHVYFRRTPAQKQTLAWSVGIQCNVVARPLASGLPAAPALRARPMPCDSQVGLGLRGFLAVGPPQLTAQLASTQHDCAAYGAG
jgi:hypothetical protein